MRAADPTAAATNTPYRVAIDDTFRVIGWRARGHRALAASALIVPLVAIGLAVSRRSWGPMALVIALVPLFALFRCADIWLLRRWERAIIDLWREGGLEFDDFRAAIRPLRMLPQNTLSGMLELLPGGGATTGRTMTPSARSIGAMTLHLISRCDAWCGTLKTAARCIAITSILIAVTHWSAQPWITLAAVAVVMEPADRLLGRMVCGVWRRRIAPVHGDDRDRLVAFVSRIDWRTIPCREA